MLARANHIVVNRLSRNERLVRNSGYRVRRGLVLIRHVGDVHRLVYVNVVVDVGDLCSVDDGGVRDVDVGDVGLADAVRRAIDVARSQGEPRHARGGRTANRNAHSPMRAAYPGDQRRRIHRAHVRYRNHRWSWRDRHPAPHATYRHPTTIVEWSKAPRFVVNPSPAPRRDPNPMAVTIGRPADNDSMRKPHVAVPWHGAPATVFIQVLVADNIVGNVTRRNGVVVAQISLVAPLIEVIVILTNALDVGVQLIRAIKNAFFTRMNGVGGAAASDFSLAITDRHNRGVARLIYVDAVAPGAKNGKRQIGRVHLEGFIIAEPAHANVQRSFGQAQLGDLVAEVQERKTGVVGEP